MPLPPETAEIFAHLAQGNFLSVNSQDARLARLFQILAQHQEPFEQQIAPLGYQLGSGNGYFFLSQSPSEKNLQERKERFFRFIDWLDCLLVFHPAFGPGFVWSLEEMSQKAQEDPLLRKKILSLEVRSRSEKVPDRLRNFARLLERESLVEAIPRRDGHYLVLQAFACIQDMVANLQLSDASTDSLP